MDAGPDVAPDEPPPTSARSSVRRVADFTPGALATELRADARLLLPVGALTMRWAHLPTGADTVIVDRLADDLSARSGVLRAPTVSYGTTESAPAGALGATSVRKKTLHRLLNDLLAEWELHGVDEFVLVTAHRYDAHLEALATVITARARVRVVDALAVNCTDLLVSPSPDERDEETATSLLLHLAPELVRIAVPVDDAPHRTPRAEPAAVGLAAASAEKGERIYARILGRIATRVLGVPVADAPRFAVAALLAGTLAAALARPSAARAQVVAVDEGSFVVTRAGATIGREQFRIVRQPVVGGAAAFVARSVAAYGTHRVIPALQTDESGAPLRYQVEVRGDGIDERVSAQAGATGHFAAQVRRHGAEGAREYLLAPSTVIVDDDTFHQLYFVARRALAGATVVPVLVPRTDAQLTVAVTRVGSEAVTIGGTALPAIHFALTDARAAWRRDLWVDRNARVLRVLVPATGVEATREDPPR